MHAVIIGGEELAVLISVGGSLLVAYQHFDFVDWSNMLQLVNTLHRLVMVVLVDVDFILLSLLLLPIHVELCPRCLIRP